MAEVSRILVVDDDPDIREVLRLLLSESYVVAEAPDGLAAITYMKENPDTDLVVLDVMMPGLDGIETCARLRAQDGMFSIPALESPAAVCP